MVSNQGPCTPGPATKAPAALLQQGLLLAALLGLPAAPAQAGTISGRATLRPPASLPAGAVLEVILEDISRADAPARVLARLSQEVSGTAPMGFSLPYRDEDLRQARSTNLRGRISRGDRLLFVSDTIHPVSGADHEPVELVLVAVTPARGQAPAESPRDPPLRGTLWSLLQRSGSPQPPEAAEGGGPPPQPSLQFLPQEDRVAGSGGCNRLIGGFTLQGRQLRFGRMASTMMACSPARMEKERRFLSDLEAVRSWRLRQGRLELLDARGRILLRFEAMAA